MNFWIWSSDRLQYFDNERWITLTSENSGLSKNESIFGVYVDGSDRVWVGSSQGVSMVAVKNALTISPNRAWQHRNSLFLQSNLGWMSWSIPAVFAFLSLAVIVDTLPAVLMAFALGLLVMVVFGLRQDSAYGYVQILPGMGAALAGMIGGLIGGAIDRLRSRAGKLKRLWSFILAVNSFERER